MAFKARCTGNEDGTYSLSYGKGSKKLSAVLRKASNGWVVDGTDIVCDLKRDTLAEWGLWAASAYGSEGQACIPPLALAPMPPKGPPAHKPKVNQPITATEGRYVVRPHVPNPMYEYRHGYALIDTLRRVQVGWTAHATRANELIEEMNNEASQESKAGPADDREADDGEQSDVPEQAGAD